jgi:hypothetical protein
MAELLRNLQRREESGTSYDEFKKMVPSAQQLIDRRRQIDLDRKEHFMGFCIEQAKIRQRNGHGEFNIFSTQLYEIHMTFYLVDGHEDFYCQFDFCPAGGYPTMDPLDEPVRPNDLGAYISLDICKLPQYIIGRGKFSLATDIIRMENANNREGILKCMMFTQPSRLNFVERLSSNTARRRFFLDDPAQMQILEERMMMVINPCSRRS